MLLLRFMSGSMALQRQEFVSMSMDHATTKGYVDSPGLGCLLEPSQCQRAVQSLLHPSLATVAVSTGDFTLPGYHSRDGLGGEGMREQALSVCELEIWP